MKNIAHYIYEMFQLKQIRHSGWYMANIEDPDTVAEHALLASQIGYILAELEGADKQKVIEMLLFHDNPEVRIGDINKAHARYITNKKEIEDRALDEQISLLPESLRQRMWDNHQEMEKKETLEAQVVKDADYLEMAFQARVYQSQGNK
ncbi:MAG: HD domain-containing protein [Patescibacteria group bacterium]|nr:HD domain-containing protein [Patescibacteria group bacterium]